MDAQKKIVTVRFPSGYKDYHFLNHIEDICIGDSVVCDTVNGYVVGEVTGYGYTSSLASKMLVQKVDVAAHNERLKQLEEEAKKQRAIDKLKKDMEKRRQKIQDVQVYALLAKSDPEMAVLLNQLRVLEGDLDA